MWSLRRRVKAELQQVIQDDANVRWLISRCVRSEVKSYLEEMAEAAEVPFPSPAGFIRAMHDLAGMTATTNLARDPDEPYDPQEDAPFSVITRNEVTLPNGLNTAVTDSDWPAAPLAAEEEPG